MSRISIDNLVKAIKAVQAMNSQQKETLADELFRTQPTLFGACLVLPQLGVSLEKMELPLNLLFICFQAMKQSGLPWPCISEDELERQAARYAATLKFSEGMLPELVAQAQHQYATSHPEPELLAYVSNETSRWLSQVAPEDSDRFVLMAAMNMVNCIAHVPLKPMKK
ncbi:MAG: hypothetical protein V4857_10520 [Pseudomonadota bacterium]